MFERRSFLRGLAALPLIGGSVTLIGNPSAAAVPTTDALLSAYDQWLDGERSQLCWERYGRDSLTATAMLPHEVVWRDRTTGRCFDVRDLDGLTNGFDHSNPAFRAAVILSAAGVPLNDRR